MQRWEGEAATFRLRTAFTLLKSHLTVITISVLLVALFMVSAEGRPLHKLKYHSCISLEAKTQFKMRLCGCVACVTVKKM